MPVTVDAALEALGCFGLGPPLDEPERVPEAWSNDVFRIRTPQGTYAVKLCPPTMRAELETGIAVEAVALATGRIPMPMPVPATGTGRWVAAVETADGLRFARCHEWVEGRAGRAVRPDAGLVRDVGRSLGVLHALRLPGGDTSGLTPVDMDRWHRAVAGARRAGLSGASELAGLTALVEDQAGRLDAVRRSRWTMRSSHRDLDPKNAVVRPDGRVALTDWDHAGPVVPGVELVVAAVSFAGGPLAATGALVADFVAAYRAAGGDAEPVDGTAMAVEAADVDWLLRNVEAARPAAAELIARYPAAVQAMERWARFVAVM